MIAEKMISDKTLGRDSRDSEAKDETAKGNHTFSLPWFVAECGSRVLFAAYLCHVSAWLSSYSLCTRLIWTQHVNICIYLRKRNWRHLWFSLVYCIINNIQQAFVLIVISYAITSFWVYETCISTSISRSNSMWKHPLP